MTIEQLLQERLEEGDKSCALVNAERNIIPKSATIAEARDMIPGLRSLELHLIESSCYWVKIYGFENIEGEIEVPSILTPGSVFQEISDVLGLETQAFQLMWGVSILDPQEPFDAQGLVGDVELLVDLQVTVRVALHENDVREMNMFASDSVGDIRRELGLDDFTALFTTSPDHRVTADPWCLFFLMDDPRHEAEIVIEMTAEPKVLLFFQPLALVHLRQELPVALSCTPVDLYPLVSESFNLALDFRLMINRTELDDSETLRDQLESVDDVIEIDILRPCSVRDLWYDLARLNGCEEVFLHCTDDIHRLCSNEWSDEQRLYRGTLNWATYGAMVDVCGPTSGQLVFPMDFNRDTQRSLALVTRNGLEFRVTWALTILLRLASTSRRDRPNRMMLGNELLPARCSPFELQLPQSAVLVVDPDTVFFSLEKRISFRRFPRGATLGDVRAALRQITGCPNESLTTKDGEAGELEMKQKLEPGAMYRAAPKKIGTEVTVALNDVTYSCSFKQSQVTFSEVMVEIGRQKKILPRPLFNQDLFCCGCGRHICHEEEEFQVIPAPCCRVKSLQLTDRRMKGETLIGLQLPDLC